METGPSILAGRHPRCTGRGSGDRTHAVVDPGAGPGGADHGADGVRNRADRTRQDDVGWIRPPIAHHREVFRARP